jgi:uncharacterized protein with PIN domain
METRYYSAQTIAKEALCDECGTILKYVKSDFSRKKFSWLHWCEKCHKKYWLDNRYPLIDYLIDTNTPLLQFKTDPIQFEEGNKEE